MANIVLTETATASIATPSSGKDAVFVDSSDSSLKVKNSSGNTRTSDNTVYRTLYAWEGGIAASSGSGTYMPGVATTTSGSSFGTNLFPAFYLSSADYGTGAKLRLVFSVVPNNVAPGTITFTGGLYNFTVAGTAGAWTPTVGTVVTGSTVARANPSAATPSTGNSGDFTFSAANLTDNALVVAACVTNASTAANTNTKWTAALQIRNA